MVPDTGIVGYAPSPPNINRNSDTKGLRFMLTSVTAHDIMNTDNYSDVI